MLYRDIVKFYGEFRMKKIGVFLFPLLLLAMVFGCKSGPEIYVPPPMNVVSYKTVSIEVVYDPLFLMTVEDSKNIVEELTAPLTAMGFTVTNSQEFSDMILRITIDELILSDRHERLFARTSFGLAEGESFMKYTASFIDVKTFEEIESTSGEFLIKKYFPSREEIKGEFFSSMQEEIITFIEGKKTF
jgi:hypothetical protein